MKLDRKIKIEVAPGRSFLGIFIEEEKDMLTFIWHREYSKVEIFDYYCDNIEEFEKEIARRIKIKHLKKTMELKHWTDKLEGGLLKRYEEMFADLRDKEIKYLEVGVLKGGSIEWAQKFFPKGKIVGADIHFTEEAEDLAEKERITFREVDQKEVATMQEIGKEFGEFDIIIDDGSHRKDLTLNTFSALWKYVKSGGWYIIEDWSAGYSHSPEHKQYEGMVELVSQIMIDRGKHGISNIKIEYEKKSFAAFRKL
ncbi:MAG: class I SAM-dependent methyltransferase [Parcubacteria group bacterium]|jgi:hypothetical protein